MGAGLLGGNTNAEPPRFDRGRWNHSITISEGNAPKAPQSKRSEISGLLPSTARALARRYDLSPSEKAISCGSFPCTQTTTLPTNEIRKSVVASKLTRSTRQAALSEKGHYAPATGKAKKRRSGGLSGKISLRTLIRSTILSAEVVATAA